MNKISIIKLSKIDNEIDQEKIQHLRLIDVTFITS